MFGVVVVDDKPMRSWHSYESNAELVGLLTRFDGFVDVIVPQNQTENGPEFMLRLDSILESLNHEPS